MDNSTRLLATNMSSKSVREDLQNSKVSCLRCKNMQLGTSNVAPHRIGHSNSAEPNLSHSREWTNEIEEEACIWDYDVPMDMATTTSIRPIEAMDEVRWRQHWAAYNEFYERTHRITADITRTTFSRFLDPKNPINCGIAIVNDGSKAPDIVGFVTFYQHPSTSSIADTMYLQDLFVDPECRNGGIGRKLIDYVYEEADKRGCANVYWHTQYFNHRAQLLYTEVGRRTDFIRYDRR